MTLHVQLSDDKSSFVIHNSDPSTHDKVRRIVAGWPGWKRQPSGVLSGPCSVVSSLFMSRTTLKLGFDQNSTATIKQHLANLQKFKDAIEHGPSTFIPSITTQLKPRAYQLKAIFAAKWLGGSIIINDDMGLGKTAEALWIMQDHKVTRCVIVCPVSVKWNWPKEIGKFLGKHYPALVIDGSAQQRANQFVDLQTDYHWAVVINYDLLRHLSSIQGEQLKKWLTDARSGIIMDESQYVKSSSAARTMLCQHLAECTMHRILLSGTPIQDTVADVYSQVEMVAPGTWLSHSDFDKRYLVKRMVQIHNRSVVKTVGAKNLSELNLILNTMVIRRLKETELDLPPKVFTQPELTLEEATAKIYDSMKRFAVLQLEALVEQGSSSMSIWQPQAKSATTAMLRCEQIAQGFVGGIPEGLEIKNLSELAEKIPGRPREFMFPNAAKPRWLLSTIRNLVRAGKRPVVFSRFNAPMFWFEQKLNEEGISCRVLHGALSSKDKQLLIDQFQGSEFQVFFIQVMMAEGFNLTNSQDVLIYSRPWAPARVAQAIDRVHRSGQMGTVNVQIPIVRGTIEVFQDRKLQGKGADAEAALKQITVAEMLEAL